MRLAAQAKGGFYPTPPRVVDLIAELIHTPSGAYHRGRETLRILDPCCRAGEALAQLAEGLDGPNAIPIETYGVELHRDRAEEAEKRLDHALASDLFATSIANGAFGLLLLNPPYDYDSEDKRTEHAFLTHTTRYLAEGGLLVPSDYGGVMVTDRGRSYDAQALSGVKQQKCLAHVLRSISEVVQTKRGRGRSFGNRLSRLLREAMELRQAYHRGEAADFAAEAERLRREATYHLRDRPMSDADNWRLQNELGWHHDRGNLLRFLDDPSIEPTNNRAERALRGAVIARKVSHCSKNVGGADAFSAFTSVIRTLARNGGDHSLVNGLCGVFSGAPVPTPSF